MDGSKTKNNWKRLACHFKSEDQMFTYHDSLFALWLNQEIYSNCCKVPFHYNLLSLKATFYKNAESCFRCDQDLQII